MNVVHLRSADRTWAISERRTIAAHLLIRRWGYRAGEVAVALNRDPATLSSMLTRFDARLQEEPATQREVERLARTIKL